MICEFPQRAQIDKMIADGQTQAVVAAYLAAHGLSVHRNTISHHKTHHVKSVVLARADQAVADVKELADRSRARRTNPGDLAVLVRDRVIERIEAQDIDPTVQDGLRAQEILDRRMEKQGDRDLILSKIFVLFGPQPVELPAPTFEGTWVTRQLPPRVVSPDEWEEPSE